jgi:hypothetical protein
MNGGYNLRLPLPFRSFILFIDLFLHKETPQRGGNRDDNKKVKLSIQAISEKAHEPDQKANRSDRMNNIFQHHQKVSALKEQEKIIGQYLYAPTLLQFQPVSYPAD